MTQTAEQNERFEETNPERVRRLLLVLDGLRYSFEVVQICYQRATAALHTFENVELGAPRTAAISAIADIWSIVDAIHRIRQLLTSLPYVSKQASIRIYLDATAPVEDLRHYVQHIKNEIGSLDPSGPPLWGVISWVSESDASACFTIATGTLHTPHSLPGITVDRLTMTYVAKYQLIAGETAVALEDLASRTQSLSEDIELWANSITFATGTAYVFKPACMPVIACKFVAGPPLVARPEST